MNLSHMASFHSNERIAPSNRGIEHLGYASISSKGAHARFVEHLIASPALAEPRQWKETNNIDRNSARDLPHVEISDRKVAQSL